MAYPGAEAVFADAEAKRELAQALYQRAQPIAGTPAETYIRQRLPAAAANVALDCADLRYLAPPIENRPPQDHALMSLLRDAAGAVSGMQLEFVDILGARTGTEPNKQTYALREHGVRDGLFRAGGEGDAAHLVEGYSFKAFAIVSLGVGRVYGGGGRQVLGCAVPDEQTVVIVPDRRPPDTSRDAPDHDRDLKRAADLLLLAGKTVVVAKAPDCHHPGGGACKDADDFLRRHGPTRLKALVEDVAPTGLSLDGEARKLAQVDDPLERDQKTKATATRLKVKVALLRDRVAHYRQAGGAGAAPGGSAPGRKIEFDKLGMAPDPVDGTELLDDLAAAIRRHAFIDECDLVKAVLWTIHGHRRFHGNVQVLPRLVITAGREDSGKTSLAVALAHTSDVALVVVSPRPAIVYRSIEAHQVALFLDEADVWYPRNEDLRDLVNSGFNKDGALVARTEDVGALGKREHEVRLYSTFTPMAIVGINLEKVLARTVLSRALIIRMAPARVGEVVDDIFANPPAVKALREIASRIKRWAMDNEGRLATAKSDMPGVINRLRLVWGPLLAIADAAGGDWPGRARAALEVERGRIRDPNLGEALLLDALQVITEAGATGLHTKDLIERLLPLEMRTWSAFGRRRVAIRDIEVADLLAPYGLKPKQLKIGAINRRGYRLEDIQAAIERYVVVSDSEDTPEGRYPATDPQNPRDTAGSSGSGGGRYRDATSSDPLPENDFPGEVAATSKLDATDFIAENQCGSGVAPPRPPEHEHTAAGAVGAQPDGPGTVTITLVCKGCGQAFEHERKRGRPSMKCPGCRAGGSGGRLHPHQDADEQPATDQVHQPTLDEVVDQVSAGLRCSYCGMPFTDLDGEPVEIAGKLYHRDDACAGTVRRRLAAEARS